MVMENKKELRTWLDDFQLNHPLVIAGPCSAETEEQVLKIAHELKDSDVSIFRAGIWKPRTRPGSFEGMGEAALPWLQQVKKETGMLFVDYIQKERIEAACNMLTYSDYTAAQISEYLCFSTQSYFIKIFRKYTGTTPAKYKKYKVQDWK